METKIVDFKQVEALSVVQLATSNQNTSNYISGSMAMKNELVSVEEVDRDGDVNRLMVSNTSDKYIFFMDGDILIGAKQNRVLNTSVYLHPESKVVIPVSCVEQGRWRHKTKLFQDSDYSAPSHMRARKARGVKANLKKNMGFESDQLEVWNAVKEYSISHCVASPTANLGDVFDSKAQDFDKMVDEFSSVETGNGIAIFIGSKLLNIDIFNRTDIYLEYFRKLIRGAVMDAINQTRKKPLARAEAEYKALTFLDKFETLEFETHQGVAAGTEKRFNSDELTGFELSYLGKLIHIAALNLE